MPDHAHAENEDTTEEAKDGPPPPEVPTFTPIFDMLLSEFELEWPNGDSRGPGNTNEWFEPLRKPARNPD